MFHGGIVFSNSDSEKGKPFSEIPTHNVCKQSPGIILFRGQPVDHPGGRTADKCWIGPKYSVLLEDFNFASFLTGADCLTRPTQHTATDWLFILKHYTARKIDSDSTVTWMRRIRAVRSARSLSSDPLLEHRKSRPDKN